MSQKKTGTMIITRQRNEIANIPLKTRILTVDKQVKSVACRNENKNNSVTTERTYIEIIEKI
jgi:hypothetical protein